MASASSTKSRKRPRSGKSFRTLAIAAITLLIVIAESLTNTAPSPMARSSAAASMARDVGEENKARPYSWALSQQ